MSSPRLRRPALVLAALMVAGSAATAAAQVGGSQEEEEPPIPSITTTTVAPTTSTTAPPEQPPDDGEFDDGESTPAPEGAGTGQDGDGTAPPTGQIVVPPEAQAIINSVARTGPSNNADLVEGVKELETLGLTPAEAIDAGFGRFIIAGPANYYHDWLYPRYGPGFRFHLGTDVFAAYGTPVRAPVDGTVESGEGDLGGIYVKVYMDDGTYFYMAHLSALPEAFEEGMAVETGDIVGYVGDSGNARGGSPHVHLGVYPRGGGAVDPKPILDRFLDDARARLPEVVAFYRQQRSGAPATRVGEPLDAATRPFLASALLRPLTSPVAAPDMVPTEVLFASSANPAGGALELAEAEAATAAASIDWQARSFLAEARLDVMTRSENLLRLTLEPFLGPAARDRIVVTALRSN